MGIAAGHCCYPTRRLRCWRHRKNFETDVRSSPRCDERASPGIPRLDPDRQSQLSTVDVAYAVYHMSCTDCFPEGFVAPYGTEPHQHHFVVKNANADAPSAICGFEKIVATRRCLDVVSQGPSTEYPPRCTIHQIPGGDLLPRHGEIGSVNRGREESAGFRYSLSGPF